MQISETTSPEAEVLKLLSPILPEREGSPPAVVFHGVNGENLQDPDSPSWYNPQESTQVYLYLVKLFDLGLTPDDIGIIAPYLKQVNILFSITINDLKCSLLQVLVINFRSVKYENC